MKWVAEEGKRGMLKNEMLLKRDMELWRAMIAHVLKGDAT